MEEWDVYDIHGNSLGYTKTRDDTWTPEEYHLGASLWIVNSSGELLIQKRSAQKKRYPNVWCNVGGSVVAGESSRQGCAREAEEEIGVSVCGDDLVFLQRSVSPNTINDNYALLLDFSIGSVVAQPEEVGDVKWASVEEIKSMFHQGLFMMDKLVDMEMVIEYIDKMPGVRA